MTKRILLIVFAIIEYNSILHYVNGCILKERKKICSLSKNIMGYKTLLFFVFPKMPSKELTKCRNFRLFFRFGLSLGRFFSQQSFPHHCLNDHKTNGGYICQIQHNLMELSPLVLGYTGNCRFSIYRLFDINQKVTSFLRISV